MERQCYICKNTFPLSDIINNKRGAFGKGYKCKNCTRLEYRKRRMNNIETHKRKDRNYYLRNRDKILKKRKKYNRENKNKTSARAKVMYAVYSGKLRRPNKCSNCNIRCLPDAHHKDYSKPLEVIWLCRRCHQIVHNGK